jgi:hypothetical protein
MYLPVRKPGPVKRLLVGVAVLLLRFAGCEDETCFCIKRLSWSPWRSEHTNI